MLTGSGVGVGVLVRGRGIKAGLVVRGEADLGTRRFIQRLGLTVLA